MLLTQFIEWHCSLLHHPRSHRPALILAQNSIYSTKLSHTAFIFDRIVNAHIVLTSNTRKATSAMLSTKAPTPFGQFYQLWSIWLAVKWNQWCKNREIYYFTKEKSRGNYLIKWLITVIKGLVSFQLCCASLSFSIVLWLVAKWLQLFQASTTDTKTFRGIEIYIFL